MPTGENKFQRAFANTHRNEAQSFEREGHICICISIGSYFFHSWAHACRYPSDCQPACTYIPTCSHSLGCGTGVTGYFCTSILVPWRRPSTTPLPSSVLAAWSVFRSWGPACPPQNSAPGVLEIWKYGLVAGAPNDCLSSVAELVEKVALAKLSQVNSPSVVVVTNSQYQCQFAKCSRSTQLCSINANSQLPL